MPCRDEAAAIARWPKDLFPALDALGAPWELIIVDDGSSDETAGAAAAAAAAAGAVERTKVLRLSPGRGLGGALKRGFAECAGEWIAALDADLTFAPADLARLLDAARTAKADLVAGSPFLRAGDLAAVPWARRLPSLMLNAFYRGLFDMRLTAYTPMFRLYRAERLRELDPRAEGFEISAELAARAARAGWALAEVPVSLKTRTEGASKLRRGRELKSHLVLLARLLAGR